MKKMGSKKPLKAIPRPQVNLRLSKYLLKNRTTIKLPGSLEKIKLCEVEF